MYNAEPLADFIDLVSLGEGEDVTVELVELHRRARREGWSKPDFLRAAAQLAGHLRAQPVRRDLSRGRHRGVHHAPGRRAR